MAAHQPHRLPRGGAHRRRAKPLHQPADGAVRRLAGLDHPRRHAERPGRGVDQEGARFGLVVDEVALAELVLDEAVGGAGIRHAQQRFGQHHQRQALLGGEREFAQHVLDAAKPVVVGADGFDQPGRGAVDPRLVLRGSTAPASSSRAAMAHRPARRPPRTAAGVRDRCHRMRFKFPCTIRLPPVLASRNRCDSFADFRSKRWRRADAKIGTSRRSRQSVCVLRSCLA